MAEAAIDCFAWLEPARVALNADPAFRKLGSADFRLGLAAGDSARLVTFSAFEIAGVEAVESADLREADLIIEMAPADWDAYLTQRAAGQGPSLLSLDLELGVVSAGTPLERLLLERYNRTIQALLDCGARHR